MPNILVVRALPALDDLAIHRAKKVAGRNRPECRLSLRESSATFAERKATLTGDLDLETAFSQTLSKAR